ncbi:hypothetical protein GKS17_08075 [Streptococcus uberis]|uniref:hypothetical protein n=1 Tax=Streptococcus uberis TaxID=1349 RepID=UPI0012B516BE|nr:hypothetical protein [Streptococcus uberis]MCK1167686.1 hypothetical protein [Streptococcus uberis]MTC89814.1 hypothetical protein [Streptococcus uberis]MTC96744.1 hypothetical protein [Streptococcus uberis]
MKHKIKVKHKPFSKFLFLIPFLFSLTLSFFVFVIYKERTLLSINNDLMSYILIWSIIISLILLLMSYLLSPFFIYHFIKNKLKRILYINNFYATNNKNGEVLHSAEFIYWKQNNKLYIQFHPNGLNIANRMNDLQPILETSLKMYVEEVDDSMPNFTLYVLSKNNGGNRIDVSEKW